MNLFIATGSVLIFLTLLPFYRMIKGPTVQDRIISFDMMNTLVMCSMISFSVGYQTPTYVDVAVVYILLSYIATLYLAKYLEGNL